MENWSKYEPKFRCMMLSRMKQDCDYYLSNGNRSAKHLWADNEADQIDNMIALWKAFDPEDKPEWLTMEQILDYAKRMGVIIDG